MRYRTQLVITISLLLALLLNGCSAGRRAFSKAEKAEAEGRFEEAMYGYAEAFGKDPEQGTYRMRFFSAREKAAQQRFNQGKQLFDSRKYAEALAEFQAAAALDPTQGKFQARPRRPFA